MPLPILLGNGAGGGGMLEKLAGGEMGEHLVLDLAEHAGEVYVAGVGRAAHTTNDSR